MLRQGILVIILCCLLITGCSGNQNTENEHPSIALTSGLTHEQTIPISAAKTPITIKLTLEKIPLPHEETTLHVDIKSILNSPGTDVIILLPPDGEIISGTLTKKIDLKANIPESFETVIRFSRPGDVKIIAKARKVIDQENSWGDMDVIYVTIGEFASKLTSAKPAIYAQREQSASASTSTNLTIITGSSDFINTSFPGETVTDILNDCDKKSSGQYGLFSSQNSPGRSIVGIGTLTVRGNLQYYTKVVNGKLADYRDTDDNLAPRTHVYIRINSSGNEILGQGYSDNSGDFSINITNPYPNSFIVYVYTFNQYLDPLGFTRQLRVINNGTSLTGLTNVYAGYIGPITPPDGTQNLEIGTWFPTKGSDSEHAFMLFQDLIRAREFIGWDVGSSTILWYPTSTEWEHYHPGGQIHLGGEDYLSADPVIHEFGHNYMWSKKGSYINTCPNPHYVEFAYNSQCGYTEGWPDFLPLVVNSNPSYTWASGASENWETPTWGTPLFDNGDACEARVAGALWDMYDTVNDGYDQYQFPFSYSVQAMKQNTGWTFSSFWNTWNSLGYSSNAAWSIYQNTIDYRLFPDLPIVGNWNGDLITDVGLFRPSNGNWYMDHNKDGIIETSLKFGVSGDIPLVGDWNGDGTSEIGVFRPSTRQFILNTYPITRITYGMGSDIPLTGDWNGDGNADIGVFRPSTRQFILNTNPITRITYGMSSDIPLTGDWNGDGNADIGVFRPSTRQFILNTNPITRITYGMSNDTPLTGDWNGDDISDIGVYRSSARQFILNTNPITRITY